MKAVTVIMVLAVGLATAGLAAEILDGVAAVVNDRVITYSDVRAYVQPVVAQLRRQYSGAELIEQIRTAQRSALEDLIERALILDEFKAKGYSIPDSIVENQIREIISNDYGGDRTTFIRTLRAQNMTLSQFREQVRERIILQAMRARKAQAEVIVSPYKIEQYYREHQEDFRVPDQVKLRMIYIKKSQPTLAMPTATNHTDASMIIDPRRQLAEQLLAKLDAGEGFENLARLYSEGKEAKEGGDWGWIGRDVLRRELNEAAFQLQPGQHSRLIETEDGYYILYVEDFKAAHVKPLTAVRDEIEKILLQQQRTKMQQQWISDLRSKAYVRLY